MSENIVPTKQRRPSVSPISGAPTPPGFEAHPERRHNGAWKKENTPRYKMEKLLSSTQEELEEHQKNPEVFVSTIASILLRLKTVTATDKAMELESVVKSLERMINQVYGTPKQSVDVTTDGESLSGIKVSFEDTGK